MINHSSSKEYMYYLNVVKVYCYTFNNNYNKNNISIYLYRNLTK